MTKYELFRAFFNDSRVVYVKAGQPIRYNMRILDVGFRRKRSGTIGIFATIHSENWQEATMEAAPEDLTATDTIPLDEVELGDPFQKKAELIQAIEEEIPVIWTHPQYGAFRDFRISEINIHRLHRDGRLVWDAVVYSADCPHSAYHVHPHQLAIRNLAAEATA